MDNLAFQSKYDAIYKSGQQKSCWPWTDLISSFMAVRKKLPPQPKILELGCGYGANIPFLLEYTSSYYSIEISPHVIEVLQEKFPQIKNNLKAGNFIEEIPFDKKFDLVIDRASLNCNSATDIKNCLAKVKAKMSPGAYFIGIDWYSTKHSEFSRGNILQDANGQDPYSRVYDESDSFFNPPRMHFNDRDHLIDLFSDFELVNYTEKDVRKFGTSQEPSQVAATINFTFKLR